MEGKKPTWKEEHLWTLENWKEKDDRITRLTGYDHLWKLYLVEKISEYFYKSVNTAKMLKADL